MKKISFYLCWILIVSMFSTSGCRKHSCQIFGPIKSEICFEGVNEFCRVAPSSYDYNKYEDYVIEKYVSDSIFIIIAYNYRFGPVKKEGQQYILDSIAESLNRIKRANIINLYSVKTFKSVAFEYTIIDKVANGFNYNFEIRSFHNDLPFRISIFTNKYNSFIHVVAMNMWEAVVKLE